MLLNESCVRPQLNEKRGWDFNLGYFGVGLSPWPWGFMGIRAHS